MAEHSSSLKDEADVKRVTYLMDQRVINARLDRLESSLEGISSAMDSLASSVERLLHSGSTAVSDHQQERLTEDQEAKEHEKKEDDHTYTFIKVARDEDLAQQIGRDIYFDLVDHDKVKCFCVKKHMLFNHFKEEVAKEFGIPVQFLRFWVWALRMNQSYRPHRPLTRLEENKTVWQVKKTPKRADSEELNLFLEVELGLDLRPIAPPVKTKDDVLLFFKHYDPVKEELRYVGRLFVKDLGKPSEILMKLKEMAGYGREEEIILYEEIKFEPCVMCDPIDAERTYRESQLEDGDIVCFQKAIRLPDVPSYLNYLHNRRIGPRLRSQ